MSMGSKYLCYRCCSAKMIIVPCCITKVPNPNRSTKGEEGNVSLRLLEEDR